MIQYKLGLEQAQVRTHHTVSLLILVLHSLVLGYLGLVNGRLQYYLLAAAGLNMVVLLAYLFIPKAKTKMRRAVTVTFIANALMWYWLGSTLMAGLLVVMALLQWIALKPHVVRFTEEGIIYPGFPEKTWPWSDVTRVMVKAGNLGIDLNDNSLVQSNLTATTIATLDEKEFNNWCATQSQNGNLPAGKN